MSIQGCVRFSLLVQPSVTRLSLPRPLFARFLFLFSFISFFICLLSFPFFLALYIVCSVILAPALLPTYSLSLRFICTVLVGPEKIPPLPVSCTAWAAGLGYWTFLIDVALQFSLELAGLIIQLASLCMEYVIYE